VSIEDAKLVEISLLGIKRKAHESWRTLSHRNWGGLPDSMFIFTDGTHWWEAHRRLAFTTQHGEATQYYPNPHFSPYQDYEPILRLHGATSTITAKELRDALKGIPGGDEIQIEVELDWDYDDASVESITLSHGTMREGSHLNDTQVAAIENILALRKERDEC